MYPLQGSGNNATYVGPFESATAAVRYKGKHGYTEAVLTQIYDLRSPLYSPETYKEDWE